MIIDNGQIRKGGIIVNPAQDFASGEMFYAVQFDGRKYLLTSGYEMVPMWLAGKRGMKTTTQATTRWGMTPEAVKQYLGKSADLDPSQLYRQIRKYISTYIFLRDDRAYSLLALWAMGTYVFRIFRYYPYIHLNAEKNSGKTTLMEVLSPVCFNGELSSDFTGAAICDEIDANASTLFIDEVEHLDAGHSNLLMRVLKSGFSKSGKVSRKARAYCSYSPKMFAGIGETDDVLADRMIRIRMMRRLTTETSTRYFLNGEMRAWHRLIVDSLFRFGLEHGVTIGSIYESELGTEDLGHLSNRSWDLWAPILSIARLVDRCSGSETTCVFPEMIGLSEDNIKDKLAADQTDNDTAKVVLILNAMVHDLTATKTNGSLSFFDADTVFSYFCAQGFFRGEETRTTLSRLLARKFGIRCEPQKYNGELARMYRISISELQDYAARYLTAAIDDHAND
jgi:hypothetical protein